MTRYLPTHARQWQPIDVRGVPIEACRLWEGDHNVEAGLYHLPQGLTIPSHRHLHWCQVFVVSGVMETALTDSLLLVTCEEDRPSIRRGLQQE